MGRPIGLQKTGGRKKGTPNKRTKSLDDLLAMCEAAGIEPFEVVLQLCKARDDNIKLAAAKEAAKYLYPLARNIEASGQAEVPIQADVIAAEVEEWKAMLQGIIDCKVERRIGEMKARKPK